MLRDWFRGAVRSFLTTAGLVAFVAGPLAAQVTTGKIQGRVTDSATGAPIAGAQVTVEGSTLGNLTNDQGFYFINEVPAGLQDVRAQFIGYRPIIVDDERILAGQTTTLNFELEQTAVELEAITVEGERNPLVPRDQVATKSIVSGQIIDQLPLDNATSIVVLQPGVIQTNDGRSFRGSRQNEEAVFVDGVLVRNISTGTSDNIEIPTNALEQTDVTVGAYSAEFSNAQSGVVSFVTKRGGPAYTGSLEAFTDQLAPDSWRTNFNRAEFTFGGPISGPLTFFLAGTAEARKYVPGHENDPTIWVANGTDICPSDPDPSRPTFSQICTAGQPAVFTLPRSSGAAGATDFVDLAAPNFVPWDNGQNVPLGQSDEYLLTGNLNYQFARGSRLTLSYTRNRNQNVRRGGVVDLYQYGNFEAQRGVQDLVTLGGYFVITQTADQQLALDLRASYAHDSFIQGFGDPSWALSHRDGDFMGFSFSNVGFVVGDTYPIYNGTFDLLDPDEDLITAYRSGAILADSMQLYPGRRDLNPNQGIPGVDGTLRFNPYGAGTRYPITGLDSYGEGGTFAGLAHEDDREDRYQVRASLDWQLGRFNRIKVGGDWTDVRATRGSVAFNLTPSVPQIAEPTIVGAFIQDRIDLGDLVIEAGLRYDYLDPNVEYPRVAGFVFNVPDSLKSGYVRTTIDPASGRASFVPLESPCNGASPCLNNYVEATTKTELSPRLGVSFPVTPTSTLRLSYGQFAQVPGFFNSSAIGTLGMARNVNTDLFGSGLANTNSQFARDIEMPKTRQYEFGYRQLIGSDLVIDIAAYNKLTRRGLTFRNLAFEDPNNPGKEVGLNVMANADYSEFNGLDLKIDKAVGNLFQGSLSYSFIDAKGTGSDPFTFTGLILRQVSNLARITGGRENPPEVLLPLETSRTHNFSFTSSLSFPDDFMAGTVAGEILRNFGLFTVLTVRSGLKFTKLENDGNGQTGPPSFAGLGGVPETGISALETPWQTSFDLRATKGFRFGNVMVEAFADWRNPFGGFLVRQVFLETGTTTNNAFRDTQLNLLLADSNLDGDGAVDDFDIVVENPQNDFNKYMLLKAEDRFGNGDGVFTVAEQRAAFGSAFEWENGEHRLADSNQNLRLGLRLSF